MKSKDQGKKNSKVEVMEIFCITRLKRAISDYQISCLDKIEPGKLISRASKGLKNRILRIRLGFMKIRAHNFISKLTVSGKQLDLSELQSVTELSSILIEIHQNF